jgi:uncharacterized protein YecE (DUF72 family)
MKASNDRALNGRIFVGTSGFSYAEWRGSFYPEDLPSKRFLPYYAERFATTEINNTFYRLPTPKRTAGWYEAAPAGFVFTLKLSQKITHIRRLKEADSEMQFFLDAAAGLNEKLGPILVQLPPNYRKNTEVLAAFLGKYASGRKLAFEFRHESWFADDVYELLSEHQVALGIVESEKDDAKEPPLIVTGPFIYMRLRKGEYSDPELDKWAKWILEQKVAVYCYMKHDQKAPVLASQLIKALESS